MYNTHSLAYTLYVFVAEVMQIDSIGTITYSTNVHASFCPSSDAVKYFTTGILADPTYIRALLCRAEAYTQMKQVT